MSLASLLPDQLNALRIFDSPAVCNAIELWRLRPRNTGYMNSSIKSCFPKFPPMAGYALPSTFRSITPPCEENLYRSIHAQLEAFAEPPSPPVITLQNLDDPCASATFGEIMYSTYPRFGAQGLITSCLRRNLQHVEGLGFLAFTNGALAAHGYCHIILMNVPVTVDGIIIYPSDLSHGDWNGVTTIPHQIASEVPQVCHEIAEAETIILNYLKQPTVTATGFNAARQECGEALSQLGRRLRVEYVPATRVGRGP